MIAIVVPTIREESLLEFAKAWRELFKKHDVKLVVVHDGDDPYITTNFNSAEWKLSYETEIKDLIFNKNDGVRNFGFYYVARYLPDAEYIITLDDDTKPLGDTIQDHIDVLNSRVSTSWLSTASEYMRGFPYNVRDESEVVLSHGVWCGVADWDAPTQLVKGNKPVEFYRGPIPKGIFYPMCGMNIAFKRKMLPYMYYAPMGYKVGLDRFADIWLGVESKKIIDKKGWAVYSGHAKVRHDRASNVWTNLEKEAKGLRMNEEYGKDPYFRLYKEKRNKYARYIQSLLDR